MTTKIKITNESTPNIESEIHTLFVSDTFKGIPIAVLAPGESVETHVWKGRTIWINEIENHG